MSDDRDARTLPRGSQLLRLYPRRWRARYADEFLALLAEREPSAREMLDILLAAFDARLRPQAWALAREERGLVLQASGGPTPPPAPAPGSKLTVGGARSEPPPEHTRRFSRRVFLRNALLGGAVVVAGGSAIAAVNFVRPNETGVFGKEVSVPLTSVPTAGTAPLKHNSGKFWLINNADGLLALYWKCPHLGCTVPWQDGANEFHCPCHKSVYDRNGVLVSGPAPRPMDLMAIRLDEASNSLIVHTGEISEREAYQPEQAFRLPG